MSQAFESMLVLYCIKSIHDSGRHVYFIVVKLAIKIVIKILLFWPKHELKIFVLAITLIDVVHVLYRYQNIAMLKSRCLVSISCVSIQMTETAFHQFWIPGSRNSGTIYYLCLMLGLERNFNLCNFLSPNFVHYANYNYPTNTELLKICYPTFEKQNDTPNLKAAWKISYPTYFSSAPTWGMTNER